MLIFVQFKLNPGNELNNGGNSEDSWKTKDSVWKKEPFIQGRTQNHNIIRGPCDKSLVCKTELIESPEDTFSLFFTDTIIDFIVNFTNIYGSRSTKVWKNTDRVEVKALIGLLFLGGINKQGISDFRDFWDPQFGIQLFSATMSKSRFEILIRCLRFDDKRTRDPQDKFVRSDMLLELT